MADFTKLVKEVAGMRGAAESTNVFIAGLEKQVDDLAAGMNDEEDQSKVEALAADIAAISATLPQAIANDPGASTGGIVDTARTRAAPAAAPTGDTGK